MSEPFQHAVSNERRGRHAAPAEYMPADRVSTTDHSVAPDRPAAHDDVAGYAVNGHTVNGIPVANTVNGHAMNGATSSPNGHPPTSPLPAEQDSRWGSTPLAGHVGNGTAVNGAPVEWSLPLAPVPPPPPTQPPNHTEWPQSAVESASEPLRTAPKPSGVEASDAPSVAQPAPGGEPPESTQRNPRKQRYSLTDIYSLPAGDDVEWYDLQDRHAAPEPPEGQRLTEPPPQSPAAAPTAARPTPIDDTSPLSRPHRRGSTGESTGSGVFVGPDTSPYSAIISPDTGAHGAVAGAHHTADVDAGTGTVTHSAGDRGSTPGGATPAPSGALSNPGSDAASNVLASLRDASPTSRRLDALVTAVSELAGGCRTLAADVLTSADTPNQSGDTEPMRATAAEVARLLDAAATGADDVLRLLKTARDTLVHPGHTTARPLTEAGRYNLSDPAATQHPAGSLIPLDSAGHHNSAPDTPPATPSIPQPREAAMPTEFPSSTALSYPPVLPLGLRDGAQAAVVARQIEAARRHLMAAMTVGHDVGDPAWRQQLLGAIEQVLAAVAEVATLARDALAPSAADTTFPGEARFLCVLPWERVPVASPDRAELAASVNGVVKLLAALGYDSRSTRSEQGILQVEVRGARYAARVLLQQLRLSGAGEWMAYLDWTDKNGQPRSGAETLGPAELSDDELARRIDDALRRRVGSSAG